MPTKTCIFTHDRGCWDREHNFRISQLSSTTRIRNNIIRLAKNWQKFCGLSRYSCTVFSSIYRLFVDKLLELWQFEKMTILRNFLVASNSGVIVNLIGQSLLDLSIGRSTSGTRKLGSGRSRIYCFAGRTIASGSSQKVWLLNDIKTVWGE